MISPSIVERDNLQFMFWGDFIDFLMLMELEWSTREFLMLFFGTYGIFTILKTKLFREILSRTCCSSSNILSLSLRSTMLDWQEQFSSNPLRMKDLLSDDFSDKFMVLLTLYFERYLRSSCSFLALSFCITSPFLSFNLLRAASKLLPIVFIISSHF